MPLRTVLVVPSVLLLAACTTPEGPAVADSEPATTAAAPEASEDTVAATASSEGMPLVGTLRPGTLVPGPGNEDASGRFSGSLHDTDDGGQLCYELEVQELSSPSAGVYVHRGAPDEAGEVVVELDDVAQGAAQGCASVAPADLAMLRAQPDGFYVNVHTEAYPDGAVRGQLATEG